MADDDKEEDEDEKKEEDVLRGGEIEKKTNKLG